MKRYLIKIGIFVSLIVFCCTLFAVPVSAIYTANNAQGFLSQAVVPAGVTQTDYTVILVNVIKAVLSLVGILFFIMVFYGGFVWFISRGNEERVKKAQGILTAAFIGIFIVVGAYVITNFVFERVVSRVSQTPTAGSGSGTVDGSGANTGDACISTEQEKCGCCVLLWRTKGAVWFDGLITFEDGVVSTNAKCTELKSSEPDLVLEEKSTWIPGTVDSNACQMVAKGYKESNYTSGNVGEGENTLPDSDAPNTQEPTPEPGQSCKAKTDYLMSALCNSKSKLSANLSSPCSSLTPIESDIFSSQKCSGSPGECLFSGSDSDFCAPLDEYEGCPEAEDVCEWK